MEAETAANYLAASVNLVVARPRQAHAGRR